MKRSNNFVLYLKGGLGNQLFQYATAYSYAKEHNKTLVINIDQYYGQRWNQEAGFILNKVVKNLLICPASKWTSLIGGSTIFHYTGRFVRKFFWKKGKVFEETEGFVYSKKLIKSNNFDGLYGYFQSPLYFNQNFNRLLENINLTVVSVKGLEFEYMIRNAHTSVAIHYRDYGDIATGGEDIKKYMGDINIEYYLKAIELFKTTYTDIQFYVFSNNIKSARMKFKEVSNLIFMDYKSKFPWEDMALMSICNHNVICNSSYSWWSAYLNKNKDKIVVAPKTYGNLLKSTELEYSLFPNSWVQL